MAPRTLPLFPLSLVLFPGAQLPLHIFEPRYRQLLADCLEGDRRFGLIFLPEGVGERELPRGSVGCTAHVERVSPFADGRSDIMVAGEERFALEAFVDTPHPYHVASVTEVADEPEPADALATLAEEMRALFQRVARAARAITEDRATLPELAEDPAQLAFQIASLIDIDLALRQRLLASRSPTERLRELERVLTAAVGSLEQRAVLHQRAKLNGKGRSGALGTGA